MEVIITRKETKLQNCFWILGLWAKTCNCTCWGSESCQSKLGLSDRASLLSVVGVVGWDLRPLLKGECLCRVGEAGFRSWRRGGSRIGDPGLSVCYSLWILCVRFSAWRVLSPFVFSHHNKVHLDGFLDEEIASENLTEMPNLHI